MDIDLKITIDTNNSDRWILFTLDEAIKLYEK